MYIDWMTWSIWALGLGLLVLNWRRIQTLRELKSLFSTQARTLVFNDKGKMGQHTFDEIHSQPDIWRRTLETMRATASPFSQTRQLRPERPGAVYWLRLFLLFGALGGCRLEPLCRRPRHGALGH